ncbi:MAG TPA: histidine kinase [Streptosporangiaceae bacterium]|jgi:signal transduction histidine kinase
MSSAPSPPRLVVPARLGTALAWCGAVVYPFVLFAVVGAGGGGVFHPPFGSRYLMPIVVVALPLARLRRHPLPVLLAMSAGLVVLSAIVRNPLADGITGQLGIIETVLADLGVGYVAAVRPRAISIAVAGAALAVQLASYAAFPHMYDLANALLAVVLGTVTVWVVGHSVRQRRQFTEARRAQAAHEAVQAERLRIARELHDMIAHSIGVIAIQAGVGGRVIETRPAAARDALATIEETSRDTLAGLRRMLGALRRTDPESAPTAPAPGLADLDALVTRSRDAGVRVDVRWHGDRAPLPPDIDLSAYRVIQESLTNVVRHSGAASCAVTVDRGAAELSVEITDDGGGGAGHPGGSGYGIPGMRERITLLSGAFSAGPRPGGGFRVAARIPVPADAP